MNEREHRDDRPSDRMTNAEFAAELQRLVARARDDGVDFDGAYDVRTPQRNQPDVTVEISEIAKCTGPYRVGSSE